MEYLLLIFIALLAFDTMSGFWETRARWREVRTGSAGIYTLRMLTGISDREELSRHFGSPDPLYQFAVTVERVLDARTPARWFFDQKWIEALLYGLALAAGGAAWFLSFTGLGWSAVFIAFVYLAFRSGHTLFVMACSYRQMLEEGRAKMRHIRNQVG